MEKPPAPFQVVQGKKCINIRLLCYPQCGYYDNEKRCISTIMKQLSTVVGKR